jgi:hypothetical protein
VNAERKLNIMTQNASSAWNEIQNMVQPTGGNPKLVEPFEQRDNFEAHCDMFNSVAQHLFFYITLQNRMYRVIRKERFNGEYMTLHVCDPKNIMLRLTVPRSFHMSVSSEL